MHSKRKSFLKTILAANAGCGCGRTNPSDVYQPTPKTKAEISVPWKHPNPSSSSSSSSCCRSGRFSMDNEGEEDCTSTTITGTVHDNTTISPQSSESDADPKASKIVDSIAVVKDSDNPYQDFKHSMLQMIFEKEIYSGDELQDLLSRFLELNSPFHHDLIIQVFSEIWNEIISKRLPSQKPSVVKIKK